MDPNDLLDRMWKHAEENPNIDPLMLVLYGRVTYYSAIRRCRECADIGVMPTADDEVTVDGRGKA